VSVTVIVVNYRTAELTIEPVRSALAEPEVTAAIVVDNASSDSDVAALRGFADANPTVTLIESSTNLGFGAAVNRAAAATVTPYLFLLNSDALVAPGSIGELAHALDADPVLGVVAPIIRRPGGALQLDAYGKFPTLITALLRTNRRPRYIHQPDWVSGVAMLVRRTEFARLGGFDERYFMYLEDVDLCRRYRAAGATVRRVASASVTHLGGPSRASSTTHANQYRESLDLYLAQAGHRSKRSRRPC
jgi:N-acetylglucosaminyl-diphospho-decaprenol L-rhamnosyltransferase